MLWKTELKDGNTVYVDLFEPKNIFLEKQFLLTSSNRMMYRASDKFYKNDLTVNYFKMQGDHFLSANETTEAIECYNKSLCFAEEGSEILEQVYLKRMKCFTSLRMFRNSFADFELGKNIEFRLRSVLEERVQPFFELLETGNDQGENNQPRLDFEPNNIFPCLADVVDIRQNERGRHIVATADIEVGKTVIVEQCYIGVTKHDHYKSCNICLKENVSLIPCDKCTSALFCANCKDNDLHEIECDMCIGCPAGFKFMDVVRSISLAKNAFANADELMAYVEDMLTSDEFELPSNIMESRSKYRAFFKSSPWKNHSLYSEQAYLFYRLLLEQESMKEYFQSEAHKRFLMHLVTHHILMILQGSFNKRVYPIGGMFITDTYINIIAKHLTRSPKPNVRLTFENGFTICTVIKPIKKDRILRVNTS